MIMAGDNASPQQNAVVLVHSLNKFNGLTCIDDQNT